MPDINVTVRLATPLTVTVQGTGQTGAGVPNGGTANQYLKKDSGVDQDTSWDTLTASDVTDFDTEVSNNTDVAANTAARHTHANKALLDTYSQTEANLADAVAKKHTHANQSVLDATTASFTIADETKLDGIEAGAEVNDVDSVNGQVGVVVLDPDDLDDTATTNKFTSAAEISKLAGIEAGAEVNNISDANATDLTDAGDTVLHFHSSDRARANHTGTQLASTISDFSESVDDRVALLLTEGAGIDLTYDDTANTLTIASTLSQYTDEMAQDAVGGILTDSSTIDLTYSDVGNTITAAVIPGGIDHALLTNLNSATYTHLTAANHTDLTDSGDSTLHFHASDRDRANHTGTQLLATISDVTSSAAELNILDGATLTTTELNFVDGVTSSIQTQFGTKVTGPASATDNAVARFDLTTGKLIQNSSMIVDDAGGVEIPTSAGYKVGSGSGIATLFAVTNYGYVSINNTSVAANSMSGLKLLRNGTHLYNLGIAGDDVDFALRRITSSDKIFWVPDGTDDFHVLGDITAANLSGTNTGDQTSIVGLTGTTAQFNTALTDGDFATLDGSEVLTNKTLTTPTIGSFTNSTHTHQNAAGGGQLDHGLALTGLTDDDHTQYALLAGRSGGQELIGGTANADDLDLNANSQAWSPGTKTGTVNIKNSLLRFEGQNAVSDTQFMALIAYEETITATGAAGFFNGSITGFIYSPIISHADSLNFGEFPAFVSKPRWQPTAAVADSSFFPITGFASGIRHNLAHSAGAGSTNKIIDFVASPQFVRSSGTGTHTITNYAGFASWEGILFDNHIKTGYTVTTARGFWARSPGVSGGTLTTNIGVDIELMASGTTNIGLRNAGTTVLTPVTQNITAATQAITVTSSVKMLTANNNYTLTAAPTIADGQNGQCVVITNVDTADTITLQDQGTLASSNLRLMATTVALAPRQSIELMYSSTVGDWVQIRAVATVI